METTPVSEDRAAPGAWERFWFLPVPTTGFAVLRILSGLLFAFWLLSFVGQQEDYFSLKGWFDMRALKEAQAKQEPLPPIDWSLLYMSVDSEGTRLGEHQTYFQIVYWGAILVFLLFALGVATRITGILTWVLVISFLANPITMYEGDFLLGILAFYLMLGHLLLGQVNGRLTVGERIFGSRWDFLFARWVFGPRREERPPSYAANFVLRLFQIHFVIIMITSGLHKLQTNAWWSGASLWYPLHPTFATTLESLQRERSGAYAYMFVLSIIAYAVLAWQIGLPVFAWRRGWISRTLLLGGAILGWIGSLFIFQLPLFGPFIFLGCLSFLSAEEWAALKERAYSVLRKSTTAKTSAEPRKAPVLVMKDQKK
jgi:hypothetical protein